MSNTAAIRRVTIENAFTMTLNLYPQDSETLTDPDNQDSDSDTDYDTSVGFTLVHVNGTVLVPHMFATRSSAGVYAVTVPPLGQLCNAIATWDYKIGGVAARSVQYVKAIASHYISLADIRSQDGLSDTSAYPTAMLVEKRDNAETLFEAATGVFWTPQYVMDVLDGDPNYRIALQSAVRDVIDYIPYKRLVLTERYPRQLLTLLLDGVMTVNNLPATGTITDSDETSFADSSQTRLLNQDSGQNVNIGPDLFYGNITGNTAGLGTNWTVGNGFFDNEGNPISTSPHSVVPTIGDTYTIPAPLSAEYAIYTSGELEAQIGVAAFPRGMENVQVEYIAGQQFMPADLWEALAFYVRYLCLHSNTRIPDRATSMTTEFGTFRIGQANAWDNPTGIDTVDSVIRRYGLRVPSFA
jgi:hypothetical protein